MIEVTLSKKSGQGFEDFFSLLCKCRWGEDFEPWKPQGRFGDFKCDGYHVPEQTVFQCYAPETVTASNVVAKIERDFHGARKHFEESMSKWVFVFNQRELNATAGALLVKLRQDHPDIEIRVCLRDDLFRQISELSDERLQLLFPEMLRDHKFDPETEERLLEYADDLRAQTPATQNEQSIGHNQAALNEFLDALSTEDREIRRRILGYSVWLSPLSKANAMQKIAGLGHSEAAILSCIERISQERVIRLTKSHILPLDQTVCQQAAETLIDEFTESLDAD